MIRRILWHANLQWRRHDDTSTDCIGSYPGHDTVMSDKDRFILALDNELRKLRSENDELKRSQQEMQQALWLNKPSYKSDGQQLNHDRRSVNCNTPSC